MTRREFPMAAVAGMRTAIADRPDVVVIVLDDLGCHDLGYLGADDLKTPNIDALARAGTIFSNWYSNAPVCAPARSSILSGRFPARAGVPTNGRSLTPGLPNLGSVFRAAGYRTAAIGKWHLGSDATTCPNAHGFDYFYGFHSGCVDFFSHRFYWGEPRMVNYHDLWRNRTEIFEDGQYLTERIGEEAVRFIRGVGRDPLMAFVAFNAPHYPMHAPESYLRRFESLPAERRVYAAMIAAVDDGVGAIRRALEASGRWDNTLVFFVGDSGATTEKRAGLNQQYATAGDNAPFKGFKFSLFDGGMHVPGFITWTGRWKGERRMTQPVMSVDILPTACEAAGLRLPTGLDGSSLVKVLSQEAPSPHDAIYWSSGEQLAVRRGRWKLMVRGRVYDRSPEGHQPLTGEDALWLSDLDTDPGETRNLRRLHPNIADELVTLAARWLETQNVVNLR